MSNLGLSSEIYPLATEDLLTLPDSDKDTFPFSDSIVVLIGDEKKGTPDVLLKGRQEIEKAVAENLPYVPVRFAFESRTAKYDILSPLVRSLRYKYKSFSGNIYHIDPMAIRKLKIERNFRTRENAYKFTKKKYRIAKNTRRDMYEELYSSMKQKGFDDRYPIDIMLCRSLGVQDTVDQGHHRMSVAIDCKLSRIAIRFGAAGQAPAILRPLFRLIAKLCLFFKH